MRLRSVSIAARAVVRRLLPTMYATKATAANVASASPAAYEVPGDQDGATRASQRHADRCGQRGTRIDAGEHGEPAHRRSRVHEQQDTAGQPGPTNEHGQRPRGPAEAVTAQPTQPTAATASVIEVASRAPCKPTMPGCAVSPQIMNASPAAIAARSGPALPDIVSIPDMANFTYERDTISLAMTTPKVPTSGWMIYTRRTAYGRPHVDRAYPAQPGYRRRPAGPGLGPPPSDPARLAAAAAVRRGDRAVRVTRLGPDRQRPAARDLGCRGRRFAGSSHACSCVSRWIPAARCGPTRESRTRWCGS